MRKLTGEMLEGGLGFRWMDGVRRAMNDKRMDVREVIEHARNRNEWRTIVTQF